MLYAIIKKILNILEHELISIYRSIGKAEYNIADGGNQFLINGKPWNYGVPMSEESKAKMIKTKLENPLPKEVKEACAKKIKSYYNDEDYVKAHSEKIKYSEQFQKSIHSKEYSEKMSSIVSNRWKDETYKEYVSKIISKKTKDISKSEQAKQNISKGMQNSVKFKEAMSSKEHRVKLSNSIRTSKAHYDSHHNPEFIARMKEIASHRSDKQIAQAKKFSKCMVGLKRYTTPDNKHTYCNPSKAPSDWILGWV